MREFNAHLRNGDRLHSAHTLSMAFDAFLGIGIAATVTAVVLYALEAKKPSWFAATSSGMQVSF